MPSAVASAQTPGAHPHSQGERPYAVGGEVTVVVGGREDTGFFNNTDYDINATRMARVRLFGEWHLTRALSVVGELRSENGTHLITPSAYVRWRPRESGRLVIQAGRIPPVFGAFPRRPYGRDNLTLGVPLAYQYLTSLRPDALPLTITDVLRMRGRGWQPSYPAGSTEIRGGVPLVSVANWDTGVEAVWETDAVELSGAVTRGTLAVPAVRDSNGAVSLTGRAAAHLPYGVTLGASASRGRWIDDAALDLTSAGRDSQSRQLGVGVDVEVGSGPFLARAEWVHARFDVPMVDPSAIPVALGADATFVEGRYRLHPRWQVGLRADRLGFTGVAGGTGSGLLTDWDAPVKRVEGVVGFRATRQLELRLGWQHNWRDGGRVRDFGLPMAAAFYWF